MSDIIQAFNDVKEIPLQSATGKVYGELDLSNIGQAAIGFGTQVFRADQQGIWLGAKKFVDAPFSVDMEGNLIASTATFGQYLTKAGTGQNLTGQILIYNGGTPSILIGSA